MKSVQQIVHESRLDIKLHAGNQSTRNNDTEIIAIQYDDPPLQTYYLLVTFLFKTKKSLS